MSTSDFFAKFRSWYLWGNLLAMATVALLLCIGTKYGMDYYTFHGKEIRVPDVKQKRFTDAEHILKGMNLQIEVSDTGYVKTLPPDCILQQSIAPGELVKAGRIVSVVINTANTPTLTIPDIIDNSSFRAAKTKLTSMGFKVGNPNYVPGEKEWVYGIKARGRDVVNGQKVSVEDVLILQVGDGMRSDDESGLIEVPSFDDIEGDDDILSEEYDDFEEVTQPE